MSPYSLRSRILAWAACLAALGQSSLSHAEPPAAAVAPLHLESRLTAASPPTLAAPLLIGQQLHFPLWNELGLWSSVPRALPGLEKIQRPGIPAYDRTTHAWYASAQGALVRIEGDGRLTVVVDNVQGIDVDVRGALKRAVSREPNDTIVLHDWGSSPASHKVLLAGTGFFGPRFSPDGSTILVRESRATAGHMWTVSLDGTASDWGEGDDPVWHPNGRHIVFDRVTTHDGLTVAASDLWVLDTVSRSVRLLAQTQAIAEVQPAISPDGKWVAYADARTGEGHVSQLAIARGAR